MNTVSNSRYQDNLDRDNQSFEQADKDAHIKDEILLFASSSLRNLDQENRNLKSNLKRSNKFGFYKDIVLGILTIAIIVLAFKKTPTEQKFFYVQPNGTIIPAVAYDEPYKRESDRIAYVETVVRELYSLSWYDRDQILNRHRNSFYPEVFDDLLRDMEVNGLYLKSTMKDLSISTAATIEPGIMKDPNAKGRSGRHAERIQVNVEQAVRQKGLQVDTLRFSVSVIISRVETSANLSGYKIINWTVLPPSN